MLSTKSEKAGTSERDIVTPLTLRSDELPSRSSGGELVTTQGIRHFYKRLPQGSSLSKLPYWISLSFICVVVLIPMIYGSYLLFYATPRFQTEFRVAVKSVQTPQQAGISALLGLGLGGQTSTDNDSNAIVQYLKSLQGVADIDQDIDIRATYSSDNIDFFSRLEISAPAEKVLRYWERMIEAYYEHSTSTIVVKVEAFSPDDSLKVANAALARSETLINMMSERAREEMVGFSQKEVAQAERRLANATANLTRVMDENGTLNPQMSAQSISASAGRLRDEISILNVRLTVQRGSMSESAPSVLQTKAKIAAAEAELEKLNNLITGANSNDPALSATLTSFTMAESERGFADRAYQNSLAALESAKIDAARRQAYLATIVKPQLAEEAAFPKPVIGTLTAVGIGFLAWIIAVVTTFAIKEHI